MVGAFLLFAIGFALRAEQPAVVLSAGARVRLRIDAPGAPPDARVEMWSSVGRVEAMRRESADLFSADYLPPAGMVPQVALLRATLETQGGREHGWLALPLVARAVLPVQTRPGSRVEVRIGGALFGPVHADAAGKAKVAVKIPPGARSARVRVRDPFGNGNETSVDLRPPPFQRLSLLALREQASWTDADPVTLQIFAVAPDGRPASAAELTVTADRGQLGELQQRAPGLFEVAFRAPDRAGGAATVRAAVAGQRPQTAAIALLAGPPAQIRLTAAPGDAGAEGDVRVQGEVFDARGNALPADRLRFSCDGAGLAQEGTFAAVHLPAARDGRSEVRVVAVLDGAQASIALPLRPQAEEAKVAGEARADGIALGALLGGQSNLSRASAGVMQAELAVDPGLGPRLGNLEVLARAGVQQFAAARENVAGTPQTSELRGLSLLAGVRASLPIRGALSAHLALLAGALRTFGTLAVEGGPGGQFTEATAQWSALGIVAAGASLRLGRGRVIAELQLSHAPGRGDVSGNLGGIGISAGYLFALR
jgi:hypothetical protein